MRKFFAVLLAALMLAALCVPAFAENAAEIDDFNTDMYLVNNEPDVQYDEWDVPYNVWVPKTDAIVVGQPVTAVLSYTIPEFVEDVSAMLLGSIEYMVTFTGLENIELVEAFGCPGKIECDYEIGICFPVAGEYANITVADDVLTVMAEMDSEVQVIVRGIATEETVGMNADVTIGQYKFPAQYTICGSVATVEKRAEGFYNLHRSDFNLVQKRDVALVNNAYGLCDIYAALNGHYYHMIPGDLVVDNFIPVEYDEEDGFYEVGDPIDKDSELFATLLSILDEYKDFFGFCYNSAAISDEMFLANEEELVTFSVSETFENGEAPVETEAPSETEQPVNPVPGTGAVSLAVVGTVALASGAGIVLFRRKEN